MFGKIIEFSAKKEYLEQKNLYPQPCKLNIPEWYKKLEHTAYNKTIKGCIPFLDTLTTGYILKIPTDLVLKHNAIVENQRTTLMVSALTQDFSSNLNDRDNAQIHPVSQLGNECPYNNKNKGLAFQKILNPWIIKTPPGYSCLFLPPLNNADDRFSIISGIVDTDTFPLYINFPIIVNGDKYPVLNTVLKKGTPYVQIIPFKRDSWKIKIKEIEENSLNSKHYYYNLDFVYNYKSKFWNKKSFK
tara:strand:- start:168 stop:899 length:732 start_codon:yes stop_codon:yes gene_type:complete